MTTTTPAPTEPTADEVVLTKRVAAPPETVFAAWLDPAQLARFMTPGPGMSVPKCETDPRVGGRFELVMKAGEQEIPHHGTYREIAPHERLVFTWESPFSAPDSVVTLTFEAVSDAETEVTLCHRGFVDEQSRTNHAGGWTGILEALGNAL